MNNRLNFKQLLTISANCIICDGQYVENKHPLLNLCDACHSDLPWRTGHYCLQCGLPHQTKAEHMRCGQCLQSTPHFDNTLALFDYDFPIDALLQSYKYQHHLTLAHFLSDCLVKSIETHYSHQLPPIDRVIPMPMHPSRLQSRGFNHALEITRRVSSALNLRLDFQSCNRTINNPPQASLPLKSRVKNVQNVFSCEQDLTGQSIVLIDDVMTTGASLNALAKSIKAAGATHVSCWVVARTLARG